MVMGTIAKKINPIVKQVYDGIAELVFFMGACRRSGGITDSYSSAASTASFRSTMYVPGCPPT
jgi:NADH-quinone oxidoreductase subunit B